MSALEKRIAPALASDINAAGLAALIAEVETAITQADAEAETERENALDVLVSPDAAKARATMEDAEFAAARLRTVLPRLQERYQDIAAQEYLAQWQTDFTALKIKRDALAAELSEVYAPCVSKIADLLTRIATNDAELSRLHQARPSGISLHLDSAELVARQLDAFTAANPSISKSLQLPDWSCSAKLVWPPPAPSLATFMPPPVRPHLGGDWWQESDARTAARLEESKRLATYYENQQRAREANP